MFWRRSRIGCAGGGVAGARQRPAAASQCLLVAPPLSAPVPLSLSRAAGATTASTFGNLRKQHQAAAAGGSGRGAAGGSSKGRQHRWSTRSAYQEQPQSARPASKAAATVRRSGPGLRTLPPRSALQNAPLVPPLGAWPAVHCAPGSAAGALPCCQPCRRALPTVPLLSWHLSHSRPLP